MKDELLDKIINFYKTKDIYEAYHYDTPGVFGYIFMLEKECVVDVFRVADSLNLVKISGYGKKWTSYFDIETTYFPGMSRYIDDEEGNHIHKLTYLNNKQYLIDNDIVVKCLGSEYEFYDGEVLIAKIMPDFVERYAPLIKIINGFDTTFYYNVAIEKTLSNEMKILIMSFLTLKFIR